jgi:ubiquinone/menaquinone biosynthesis C-methylase UbiE
VDTEEQKHIWAGRTMGATVATVLHDYRHPCSFQVEFSEYLNAFGKSDYDGKRLSVCEMGSEYGVTSMLLSEKIFERHAVDINPQPLKLLSSAVKELGQEIFTHTRDIFCTGWPDEQFDIVFSNGVLEHYDCRQRAEALNEAARITKRGGRVIVGVPNHCSLPYRSAYLIRRMLGKWHYPPEEKIRDLSEELKRAPDLRQLGIWFFDQDIVFTFLPYHRITALPFRLLHPLVRFEAYLRVFELERL